MPQDGTLEMRDGSGALNETGRLAEIGVHSGLGENRHHLAKFGDRPRIGRIIGLLVDRKRLARERGLVDAQIAASDQADIGRDDIAQTDQHQISGYAFPRRDVPPVPVTQHPGVQCTTLFKGGNGRVGLEFLPKPHACIQQQHSADDGEVRPMPHDRRQHGRRFDHPGNRTPEIG
jgi:hypothetical protein